MVNANTYPDLWGMDEPTTNKQTPLAPAPQQAEAPQEDLWGMESSEPQAPDKESDSLWGMSVDWAVDRNKAFKDWYDSADLTPDWQDVKSTGKEIAKGLVRGTETMVGSGGDLWSALLKKNRSSEEKMRNIQRSTLGSSDFQEKYWKMQDDISDKLISGGEKWSKWWSGHANKGWEAADPDLDWSKPYTKAAAVIGEGIPMFGAAIAATLATKSPYPAGIMFGAQQYGQTFKEAEAKGKSVDEASLYAFLDGVWTATSEGIPFGKMLGNRGKKALTRMVKGAVTEGFQELIQTMGSNLVAKVGFDKTRGIMDGWLEAVVGGVGLGGPGGLMIGPGSDQADADGLIREQDEKKALRVEVEEGIINNMEASKDIPTMNPASPGDAKKMKVIADRYRKMGEQETDPHEQRKYYAAADDMMESTRNMPVTDNPIEYVIDQLEQQVGRVEQQQQERVEVEVEAIPEQELMEVAQADITELEAIPKGERTQEQLDTLSSLKMGLEDPSTLQDLYETGEAVEEEAPAKPEDQPFDFSAELKEKYGEEVEEVFKKVEKQEDIPMTEGQRKSAEGLRIKGATTHDRETMYMAVENIRKGEAIGVAAHETVHGLLRRSLDKDPEKSAKKFDALMLQGGRIIKAIEGDVEVDEYFRKAYARVRDTGASAGAVNEEILAYTIQEYLTNRESVPSRLRQWVQEVLAIMKNAMQSMGFDVDLTPAQLAALAEIAIKKEVVAIKLKKSKADIVDQQRDYMINVNPRKDMSRKEVDRFIEGFVVAVDNMTTKQLETFKPLTNEYLTPFDTPEIIAERKKLNEIEVTMKINTPERNSKRIQWNNEYYEKYEAKKKEKKVFIILGSPASGKGQFADSLVEEHGAALMDNDIIKEMIDEFEGGTGAGAVHLESSNILDRIVIPRAVKNGDNIVLPKVGKTLKTIQDLIKEYDEYGYEVHITNVVLPLEKTVMRAISRWKESGRFVDPDYIFNKVLLTPKAVYDKIKHGSEVDSYEEWSTDVRKGTPAVVTERSGGKRIVGGRVERTKPESKRKETKQEVTPTEIPLKKYGMMLAASTEATDDFVYQGGIPGTKSSWWTVKRSKASEYAEAPGRKGGEVRVARWQDIPDNFKILDDELIDAIVKRYGTEYEYLYDKVLTKQEYSRWNDDIGLTGGLELPVVDVIKPGMMFAAEGPQTLAAVVKGMGGISPKAAKAAGYPYETFKEFALLGVLNKKGKGPDELVTELIAAGEMAEGSTGDDLIEAMKAKQPSMAAQAEVMEPKAEQELRAMIDPVQEDRYMQQFGISTFDILAAVTEQTVKVNQKINNAMQTMKFPTEEKADGFAQHIRDNMDGIAFVDYVDDKPIVRFVVPEELAAQVGGFSLYSQEMARKYKTDIGPELERQLDYAEKKKYLSLKQRLVKPGRPKLKKRVKSTFKPEKFDLDIQGYDKIMGIYKELGIDVRDVESFADMRKKAIGVDVNDILDGDKTNLDAADNVALTNYINNATKYIASLTKRMFDNPALALEIDETEVLLGKAIRIQTEAGTKAGRFNAAFRIMANYTMEPAYWLRKAQSVLGAEKLLSKHRRKIEEFIRDGERDKLAQYVANLSEVTWLERIVTFRKASLLTNIMTDVKNFASNSLMKVIDDVTDVLIANPMDAMISMFTGDRSVDVSLQNAFSSWGYFKKGAKEGLEILKTSIDKTNYAGNKIEFRKAFNRYSDNPAERVMAYYTDFVFNRMEAGDKPFKAMAYAKTMHEQGLLEGKRMGLSGKDLASHIATRMQDPSAAMIKLAQKNAMMMTFQAQNFINSAWRGALHMVENQLSARARAIDNKVIRRIATELAYVPIFIAEMVNPFNKVASNLILTGMDFTPIGFGKAVFDGFLGASAGKGQGQRKFVKTSSRAVMGTTLALIIASMMGDDEDDLEVNLRELAGYKERSLMQRTGKQMGTVTVRFPDNRLLGPYRGEKVSVKFHGVDPIPNFFTTAAIMSRVKKGELSYPQAFLKYVETRAIGESYLKGIGDIISMVGVGEQIEDRQGRYLKAMAGSFIPNILYASAKAADNTLRNYDSYSGSLLSRVPGMRSDLPIRYDAHGRPKKYNHDKIMNIWNTFLNPFAISPIEINRLDAEYNRLINAGFDPNKVLPTVTFDRIRINVKKTSIKLTAEQLSVVQQYRGKNVWDRQIALLDSSAYEKADDESKVSMLYRASSKAWKETKAEVLSKIVMKTTSIPEEEREAFWKKWTPKGEK